MKLKGVHQKSGSYYLVRKNKWHHLCRIEEGDAALFKALARISEDRPNTLAEIFPKYLAWAEIKPATLRSYRTHCQGILLHRFGHMRPDDLTRGDVAEFLEARRREGSATGGNRERATLSSVYRYAMRHGLAKENPCHGVARNTERPRKTFVTHDQLQAAIDRSPGPFARLLAFAYATGMRMTDCILLARSAIRDDGIHWIESKTSKAMHMGWTPWLRSLVRDCRKWADDRAKKSNRIQDRLLTNRYGRAWTESAIETQMRRLNVSWTFRDLRAKAETDSPGVLGHTGQMQSRYTRVRRVKPVGA